MGVNKRNRKPTSKAVSAKAAAVKKGQGLVNKSPTSPVLRPEEPAPTLAEEVALEIDVSQNDLSIVQNELETEEDVLDLTEVDVDMQDPELLNAIKAFGTPPPAAEQPKTSRASSLPVAMSSTETLMIKNIISKESTGVIHVAAESSSHAIGFTDRFGRNGSMFTVTFVDSNGHRIKAIFSGQAMDAYKNKILRSKNYAITIGETHLRDANQRYNRTGCKYELTATSDMKIEELPAQTIKLPAHGMKLNFIQGLHEAIDQVSNVSVVVCEVGDAKPTNGTNNGPASVVRRLHVMDGSTPHQVEIRLYGNDAKLPIKQGTVLNFDLLKINRNYSHHTFESLANANVNQTDATHRIRINPSAKDIPEVMRLRMLYAACKKQTPTK